MPKDKLTLKGLNQKLVDLELTRETNFDEVYGRLHDLETWKQEISTPVSPIITTTPPLFAPLPEDAKDEEITLTYFGGLQHYWPEILAAVVIGLVIGLIL